MQQLSFLSSLFQSIQSIGNRIAADDKKISRRFQNDICVCGQAVYCDAYDVLKSGGMGRFRSPCLWWRIRRIVNWKDYKLIY